VYAVITPLYSLNELDRQLQTSQQRGVTVGNCKINRLLIAEDLVLLAFSDQGLQHALGRFTAACGQTGMKISTKKTEVLCFSRRPSQCTLQVSGNTLQKVEKFKYFGVVFTSDGRLTRRLIHELVK